MLGGGIKLKLGLLSSQGRSDCGLRQVQVNGVMLTAGVDLSGLRVLASG